MKGKSAIMLSTSVWIVLSILSAIAAVFLYKSIDSQWAMDNHMTILMTIIFFVAASAAVVCGFNAATSNNHVTGHE